MSSQPKNEDNKPESAVSLPGLTTPPAELHGTAPVETSEPAPSRTPQQAPFDEEPGPALSESAQRLIGVQLRKLYRNIIDEPVPQEFLRLLDELERRERCS